MAVKFDILTGGFGGTTPGPTHTGHGRGRMSLLELYQALADQPVNPQYPPLTTADIRTFDDDAKRLVMDFQAVGWRGYLNKNHHVFMLSPDGGSTASISRSSLRGRSGKNARAQLTGWLRRQVEEAQAIAEARHTAFGVLPDEPKSLPTYHGEGANRVTTRMLAEMKRAPALSAWHKEHGTLAALNILMPNEDESDDRWAAFDLSGPAPVLLAHSPRLEESAAWEALHADRPEVFGVPENDQGRIEEDTVAKLYKCGQCEQTFDNPPKLGMHVQQEHPTRTFPCDQCDKVLKTAGALNLHRNGKHPTLKVCPVEGCGFETLNSGAFKRHTVKNHEPAAAVDVVDETVLPEVEEVVVPDADDGDTGVTSPGRHGDVLLDHLEYVPEGNDAEDQIAKIRAIVAAPLVAELRTVRAERDRYRDEVEKLTKERADFEARWNLMQEAMRI
jgi:hypothetical protein